MYRRITADRFGPPDVLKLETVAGLPEPRPGEALVRVEAAGVGYTDTIVRRGRYVAYKGGLPVTPGYDVAGIVEAIGAGVADVAVGDHVADMTVAGGYSQFIVRPAAGLIPIPAGVRAEIAIEVPLMWMTAWQMLERVAQPATGEPILVVGAAGSVGRALVALGRHLGLQVIGTCSAGSVAEVAARGAVALDYRRPDLADAIRSASGGAGVAAAFDAVGGESWSVSHRALAKGGVLVGYGLQGFLESGAGMSAALSDLARFHFWNLTGRMEGSRRRTAFYDIQKWRRRKPDLYRADASTLMKLIAAGKVVPPEPELLPLAAAGEAHERIAGGGLATRMVLDPWR